MSVQVRCPTCSKQGKIEVSRDSLKNVTRGLLAVNVSEGIVCEHSFIAYIDKNLQVRDYFTADFQIELPAVEEVKEEAKKKIPTKQKLDLDLIKINLTPSLLVYLIKMVFLKENAIVVLEESFLKSHLQSFYEFITESSFDFNFTYLDNQEYKKRKKEFREQFVFKGKDLKNGNEEIINPKNTYVEQAMIQRFFAENDTETGLIILKNEMQKIYDLANKLINFIATTEDIDTLNSKKMIDFLSTVHNEKISLKFLDFLLDIIELYMGKEVPRKEKVSDFLGFL